MQGVEILEEQSNLDSLINLAFNLLGSPTIEPIIIFVDAVNQLDEDKQQFLSSWLPEKLSPNVRFVISTIEGTISHKAIRSFSTSPKEIICGPLNMEAREAIVKNILRTYNKQLHPDQMAVLLDKDGSKYPLWLTLTCEELRVFGEFRLLTKKIESLPDDLISLEESVFERFEAENGGPLIKACLCMLEVSRHGLLETELLALLAQKDKLKEPDFNPEVANEMEQKLAAGKEKKSEQTAENIEDTKDAMKKAVQETYVNERKEDEKKKKQPDRKKGKVIELLPARDWAIIYRNLKPLLRPCGDLGEGRLDFYHRSLSKAVRKRYFSGDDDLKQNKYNFWHGSLADYFESVQDMDRKAEELPYHLEKLMDNNRLLQCLMDWEVFERMYNEDFSIDLLHSWQLCGGYGTAAAIYKEQLINLRKSEMPLIDYVEVLEKVYGFLIQAGKYREALELMQERLQDELQRLGERPDELADVYQAMALCKSELYKAGDTIAEELDDDELIVEYALKSLKYREELSGPDNEYRGALANILVAHHSSNIADMEENLDDRDRAFEAIEAADKVFRKLNDIGHMAECAMTMGIIGFGWEGVPFHTKEPYFLEAIDLCIKGYGERHLLMTRIYLNTGLAYQAAQDYQTAFKYLSKTKATCLAVFGPSHPKTQRILGILKREPYQRMEAERERSVPESA